MSFPCFLPPQVYFIQGHTAIANRWPRGKLFVIVAFMGAWKDKIVVVTGGSRGFGRIVADEFAAAGAKLVIVSRSREDVDKATAELRAAGREALGLQADVTRQGDVGQLFAQTLERFGKIDVLVNNAGQSVRGNALDTTPEQFRELMELNFIALVRCVRAAAPHLLKTRGHIVNIGSLAAKSAARWLGAYPATKHAVAAYSQQLRLELGPQGMHVLLVCPGPIARLDPRANELEVSGDVPEQARQAGAGVKIMAIDPHWLAAQILRACERRRAEIVVPGYARWLFAIQQLWPKIGDWLVLKKT
jgi:uncharacterized protein